MRRALILMTGAGLSFMAGCAAIAGIGKDSDYTFPDEEDSGTIATKDSGVRDSGTATGDSGPTLDGSSSCVLAAAVDPDGTEAGVDCNKCIAEHCCPEANACNGIAGCYACIRDKSSCQLTACNCGGSNGGADNAPAFNLYQCINDSCKNVATSNCITF